MTWQDNVRVNAPDAPDWLKNWASAMDSIDASNRLLAATTTQMEELLEDLRKARERREKHWWGRWGLWL